MATKKFPSEMNTRGAVKVTDKLMICNIDTGETAYTTVAELLAAFGIATLNGNVGINTTTPGQLLELAGVQTAVIRLKNTAAGEVLNDIIGGIEFYSMDNDRVAAGTTKAAYITAIQNEGYGQATALIFGTNDTNIAAAEKMRLDRFGNVGIGTNTPTSKLQVVGLPQYTGNANAAASGLTVGALYRTGEALKVVY